MQVDRKALHWAAGAGNEDALRLLLEHDTELDDADSVCMKTTSCMCCCDFKAIALKQLFKQILSDKNDS